MSQYPRSTVTTSLSSSPSVKSAPCSWYLFDPPSLNEPLSHPIMTPSCMFKRVLRCQRRFRKPPDRLQGTQYTHGVCSLTYLLWIQARRAGGTSMGHRPVDSLRDTNLISKQPCNLLLQRRRYSTLNIWVNKEDYMPQRGNFPFFMTDI